jgi:hypothetical protein
MKLTRRGFLQAAAVAPAAAALAQLKPGEQGRVLVPPRVLAGEAVSKGPISVGLFTGNHEITGDGYSRAGVEFNPASRGSIDNANEVIFPPAGEGWGTITHYGLFDADGELLAGGALDNGKNVGRGDTIKFAKGDLDITLEGCGLTDKLENDLLDYMSGR